MIVSYSKTHAADNSRLLHRSRQFKAGSVKNQTAPITMIPKNNRNGTGNRIIKRVNFLSQDIRPRIVRLPSSFVDTEIGKPSSVTNTKMSSKTVVQVPDPTDIEWLREKARLEAEFRARFTVPGRTPELINAMIEQELMRNPPLGRPQRTLSRETYDIAEQRDLNARQKLLEILQEIQQGRADNVNDRRAITAQMVQLLTYAGNIQQLGQQQLVQLGAAVQRVGVPTRFEDLGFPNNPKYVDAEFYRLNTGVINLYMYALAHRDQTANPRGLRTYNNPVLRHMQNGVIDVGTLPQLDRALQRANYFIDLERGIMIYRDELLQIARNNYNNVFTSTDFNLTLDPATGLPIIR